MQNNVNTNVERIIAKIDNDFNPDNSDWIPRVAAWCIDAMAQIDILRTKRKKIKLNVIDRIAQYRCDLSNAHLKVYDSNGCEVKEASEECSTCCPSTGRVSEVSHEPFTGTTSAVNCDNPGPKDFAFAETVNGYKPERYNVRNYTYTNKQEKHNYVLSSNNQIELNFDTKSICIEIDYIETYCSKSFGCDLPVIPNNGILIEAIAMYCMYKMLCRGYKHPVFNLAASQYGTNPYYIWNQLKEEAKRSVVIDGVDEKLDDASQLFRSNFFIQTFDNRR